MLIRGHLPKSVSGGEGGSIAASVCAPKGQPFVSPGSSEWSERRPGWPNKKVHPQPHRDEIPLNALSPYLQHRLLFQPLAGGQERSDDTPGSRTKKHSHPEGSARLPFRTNRRTHAHTSTSPSNSPCSTGPTSVTPVQRERSERRPG